MRKIGIFAMLIILAVCCTSKEEKKMADATLKKFVETLYLPDSFAVKLPLSDSAYSSKHATEFLNSEGWKIVSHINGSCIKCAITLKKWGAVMEQLKKYPVQFLFIVESESYPAFEFMNEKQIGVDFPVIYDYKNMFRKRNKIPSSDPLLHTYLVNSSNRIVLVGNPALSPDLMNLYEKVIKEQS